MDNRGVFRNVPVTIAGSVDKLSEPENIRDDILSLINEYSYWKESKHTVETVSLFHLKFENIRPFIDSNGRTGRILLNFELMKAGLLPVNIKFTDKRRYYAAFKDYSESRNNSSMTTLIGEYEIEELNSYIKMINDKEKSAKKSEVK